MLQFLADYTLLIILVVGGVVILYDSIKNHHWSRIPAVIMAGLTSLLVAKLISLVFQPNVMRPFIEQGVPAGAAYIDNPGFPSDHALLGVVTVLAVYAVTRKKWLTIGLGIVAVLMMMARVQALVHTPLDVVGGAAIALFGGVWYLVDHKIKP